MTIKMARVITSSGVLKSASLFSGDACIGPTIRWRRSPPDEGGCHDRPGGAPPRFVDAR